jgi:hypothetical protein
METVRIQNGATEQIEVFILDTDGNPVTGAVPTLLIRRQSDNQVWNGSAFQVASATVNMTEIGAIDPGKYYYTFDTAGLPDDTYYITADCATGANVPQAGEMKVGGYVDDIDAPISSVITAIGSSRGGANGGGFVMGGSTPDTWNTAEKEESLKLVRELKELISALKEKQKDTQDVAENIITYMREIDETIKSANARHESIQESIGQKLETHKATEELGKVMESLVSLRSTVSEELARIQEDNKASAARLESLNGILEQSAKNIEDLYSIGLITLPEAGLEKLTLKLAAEELSEQNGGIKHE